MIGGCLISASYPFTAEIWKKKRTTKPSGQTLYHWEYDKTISCLVTAFQSTSFKAQGITEYFSDEYENLAYVRMFTSEDIGKNVKIYNIKNATTGEVIYREVELKDKPPTWFASNGSTPTLDPFGRIVQWASLINRSEVQGDQVV